MYGTDGTRNATHGSDMPKNAAREIHFFFPQLHQVLRQVLIKKVRTNFVLASACSVALWWHITLYIIRASIFIGGWVTTSACLTRPLQKADAVA